MGKLIMTPFGYMTRQEAEMIGRIDNQIKKEHKNKADSKNKR